MCASCSSIRQRPRSLTKWSRTRRLRRRGCARETSFADLIRRRSTIRSRCWNTSANIQTIELVLHVERGGERFDVPVKPTLLPTNGEKKPRIGIQWDTTGIVSIQHPNPIEQVYNSVTSTLKTIGAVASPKSDVKLQHLSGPGRDRSHLLSAFSKRTRLAAGAVV